MARTGGKRTQPKTRSSAEPPPPAAVLPASGEEQPSGIGKKVIIAAAALVGLAAVVVLGITLAGEEANNPGGSGFAFPDVSITGGALPPFENPSDDPARGVTAPEASSLDFEGLPASIEHDGVPKMILFLAHWCVHCQREVPALQSWINQNGVPAGVDLVSVATSISDIRTNYPPDAWLRREGWTQRVVVDDAASRIANAYGLTSFPYYVLVDGSGNVVQRMAGSQSAELVGALLQSLAAGG